MKVLVTGCGRGGTNLGIEVIRTLGIPCTRDVEDRQFFNHKQLPIHYATKLATENNGFTAAALKAQMDHFSDLKILFMLRHPFDNVMSKILRGQPKSAGGDNDTDDVMPDGKFLGAAEALLHMHQILDELLADKKYSSRILVVKMEDLCTNILETVTCIANFVGTSPTPESLQFYKYNRNRHHQKRYQNNLAPQVDLFMNLEENFDGFFVDKGDIVSKIRETFSDIATTHGYGVE